MKKTVHDHSVRLSEARLDHILFDFWANHRVETKNVTMMLKIENF